MQVATLTIGRNTAAGAELSEDRWHAFKQDATDVLTDAGADIWAWSDYIGRWDDRPEDAHVIVAALPDGPLYRVRAKLGALGRRYGQNAIGWAVTPGESSLLYTGRAAGEGIGTGEPVDA